MRAALARATTQMLVCSDVVEDLDAVISYDVPAYVKTYIHRLGRTGRLGKEAGSAVTKVKSFLKMLKKLEQHRSQYEPSRVSRR